MHWRYFSRSSPSKWQVRISYTCTCGKKLHGDFPEEQKFEADTIMQELTQAGGDSSSVATQIPGEGPIAHPVPSPQLHSSAKDSPSTSQDIAPHTDSASSQAQASSNQLEGPTPRFLLLCTDTSRIGATGKHRVSLANVDITSSIIWNDQLLFNKIREQYYKTQSRRILSLKTPKSLYFVQVSFSVTSPYE